MRFTTCTALEDPYPSETLSALLALQIVEPSFELTNSMSTRMSAPYVEKTPPVPPAVLEHFDVLKLSQFKFLSVHVILLLVCCWFVLVPMLFLTLVGVN